VQRIPRDLAKKFAFDFRDTPLLRVQPNEVVELETWDASVGYFQSESDLAIPARRPGFDSHPPKVNPIAGPIFIEGAKRGDTLIVEIESIEVGEFSWIATGPGRGPLGSTTKYPELSTKYNTKIFKHFPGPSGTMRDGTLQFDDKISWPITPFIGTIGVCPDREVLTTIDGQGEWGGNIDCRDVCPGNKIYLPVWHEGALFYLGDVHASQGDTEFTGTAAETNSTVRLKFQVISGKKIPWMRIEKPDSIIALHVSRPLDQAVETATLMLIDWLVEEYGFTPTDAYCLMSTCPDFRINVYQMCKLAKLQPVAGAEIPKKYLE
jgi:amidase